jgi:methyltransferase (TIGR00027 family)
LKEDRPSRTAHFVALGRALADAGLSHIPGFSDPTARAFLNAKGLDALGKVERARSSGQKSWRVESSRVMADMLGLRTVIIDAAVRDAVAGGATQLVILGAGYDGRAWRMPELAGVKVFEVDHPATQGDKRARVTTLPQTRADVHFVSIDFEREQLDDVLERAGHDKAARTCWIWEGVVMYLTKDAMHATLRAVSGRSASGSTLIINYHDKHRYFIARLIFRLIGEPQISAWSREQMAADLGAAGFSVSQDSGMLDWNARFAQRQARVERGAYMRVVVASK